MEIKDKPNNTNIYLLIIGLVVLLCISICLGFFGFIMSNRLQSEFAAEETTTNDINSKCVAEGGKWIPTTKECEKISEPSCRALGGIFDACASPCRNAGGEVMCIQMCEQVCSFN